MKKKKTLFPYPHPKPYWGHRRQSHAEWHSSFIQLSTTVLPTSTL